WVGHLIVVRGALGGAEQVVGHGVQPHAQRVGVVGPLAVVALAGVADAPGGGGGLHLGAALQLPGGVRAALHGVRLARALGLEVVVPLGHPVVERLPLGAGDDRGLRVAAALAGVLR